MLLYHYTSINHIESILRNGLSRGVLPTGTSGEKLNAVSLTSDKNSSGHGLSRTRFATRQDLIALQYPLTPSSRIPVFPDTRKVRITLNADPGSTYRWLRWSKNHVDPRTRELLIATGGGMKKAGTWYFSILPIPASSFRRIEVNNDGRWVDLDAYDGPMTEVIPPSVIRSAHREWGERLMVGQSPEIVALMHDALEFDPPVAD